MGVILSTKATGIGWRPAYTKHFSIYETVKDSMGKEKKVRTRLQQQIPACESVRFVCPAPTCKKKNDQSVLSAKGTAGQYLSFICAKCKREIEVCKPPEDLNKIVLAGQMEKAEHKGLVGINGQPLR